MSLGIIKTLVLTLYCRDQKGIRHARDTTVCCSLWKMRDIESSSVIMGVFGNR
jgi:hypothetical protein